MDAQMTVRLSEDLKKELERASRRMHRRSSEVVRMALRAFLGATDAPGGGRRADRVRGLIGSLESGVPDLAERHREYVLESVARDR